MVGLALTTFSLTGLGSLTFLIEVLGLEDNNASFLILRYDSILNPFSRISFRLSRCMESSGNSSPDASVRAFFTSLLSMETDMTGVTSDATSIRMGRKYPAALATLSSR